MCAVDSNDIGAKNSQVLLVEKHLKMKVNFIAYFFKNLYCCYVLVYVTVPSRHSGVYQLADN